MGIPGSNTCYSAGNTILTTKTSDEKLFPKSKTQSSSSLFSSADLRHILNLKDLPEYLKEQHCKMENNSKSSLEWRFCHFN